MVPVGRPESPHLNSQVAHITVALFQWQRAFRASALVKWSVHVAWHAVASAQHGPEKNVEASWRGLKACIPTAQGTLLTAQLETPH
jgi:hypothetical protein